MSDRKVILKMVLSLDGFATSLDGTHEWMFEWFGDDSGGWNRRALAEAGSGCIELETQTVTWEGGQASFDIDDEVKHRLLNGLDDIGVTLQRVDAIDAFEASGRADGAPVTTGL